MTGFRSGWNLPPGCTQRDIDEAAGAYDDPGTPTEAEQLAEELYDAQGTIELALMYLEREPLDPQFLMSARLHLRAYIKRRQR